MKKRFLILIILFTSLGLNAQKNIDSILIPKEKIGVHGRNFKLDGFYYSKHMYMRSQNDTARYISPHIFFKNGLMIRFDATGNGSFSNTINQKGKQCTIEPGQDFETIIEFFKCRAELFKVRRTPSVYSIDKNILRIQSINPEYNHILELQGVVYNDSTFVITKSIDYITNEVKEKNEIYHFQSSKKPDSTKLKPTPYIKKYFFKK